MRLKTSLIAISLALAFYVFYSASNRDPIQRYNVLWLVAEDLGPYIPSFGDSTIQTPNLSRLAKEGVRYTNVFSVSGVCSPSRAALCTGMYPSSIGAHHMRTLFQQPVSIAKGLINYECVPPTEVKMVSQILRENGYYCTNNSKEDYQFYPSKMAWDESSVFAHWRNRPASTPFFSIFNFNVTHESHIWNPRKTPYDLESFPPDREDALWYKQFEGFEKPLYVDHNLEVPIPPYLPDTELVRNDLRRMYSNVVEMDKHVGKVIQQLEEDALLDETIIVWYTDHGGPLPRQKRLLYDSGLHVPMIIRYPKAKRGGTIVDHLISFVDFAPTLLDILHIDVPAYMQGKSLNKIEGCCPRKYVHAAGDRFDEHYDMIRAVRDKQFKYLRNYHLDRPYYLPVEYRERMATMQELLRLHKEGALDESQSQWFRETKVQEELFDTENDPHELHNLADDPAYQDKLLELRNECTQWIETIQDKGLIKEEDLIISFWPNKIQPKTENPTAGILENKLMISSTTIGAEIGYKFKDDLNDWTGWRIYQGPVENPGDSILVWSHRIGYAPSDTIVVKL